MCHETIEHAVLIMKLDVKCFRFTEMFIIQMLYQYTKMYAVRQLSLMKMKNKYFLDGISFNGVIVTFFVFITIFSYFITERGRKKQ